MESNNLGGMYEWNGQKLVVLASTEDLAATTIAKELEKEGFAVWYLKDKSVLHASAEDLPPADVFIVLSRHSSASGKRTLSTHSVGNFSSEPPQLGGKPACLGMAHAIIQSTLLRELSHAKNRLGLDCYDVVVEATHHGPALTTPLTFVEVGSDSNAWADPVAGQAVAQSVARILTAPPPLSSAPAVAVAFGGNHYPQKFTGLMIDERYYVGHICPRYAVNDLTRNLVKQMVMRTHPSTPQVALFDKKGMRRKAEVREWLSDLNLDVVQV